MKNSKGFITVSLVILLVIGLSLGLATMRVIEKNYRLASGSLDATRLYTALNNRILLGQYDPNYRKSYLDPLRGNFRRGAVLGLAGQIRLEARDLEGLDKNPYVNWELIDLVNKNEFHLKTNSTYRGINQSLVYSYNLVNPIFLEKENESRLDYGEIEKIDKIILEDFKKDAYYKPGLEYFSGGGQGIRLAKDQGDYFLDLAGESKFFNQPKIYLVLKAREEKSSLYIEAEQALEGEIYGPSSLEGIIYIDGDLIVGNDFDFTGILLVNGRIEIQDGLNMKLDGFLRAKDIVGSYHYAYNRNIVIKDYGTYLPGFIDLKLRNIRSEG